ncbi:hypothetical protein Tco_1457769 [Tanacetum coccineum]
MKVEESLNVTFDESPPPTKLSPLVDDDVGEEEATIKNTKVYINEMLKKFGLDDSKPTKTPMSTKIKLNKDDGADSMDSSKYRSTKIPSEFQQDYKKTHDALKIYNDPNMSDALNDIYRTLKSIYVHEGRTIDPSFYNDLSDDSVAKFTVIGICIYSDAWGLDELEKTLEQIKPYNSHLPAIDDIRNHIHRRTIHERNLKANMAQDPFDERYKLVPKKMSPLKAKQPKKPPPKRTKNVRKSKHTQLSTPSSTESPSSDNGDLPSTKLSHPTKAKTRGVTYV